MNQQRWEVSVLVLFTLSLYTNVYSFAKQLLCLCIVSLFSQDIKILMLSSAIIEQNKSFPLPLRHVDGSHMPFFTNTLRSTYMNQHRVWRDTPSSLYRQRQHQLNLAPCINERPNIVRVATHPSQQAESRFNMNSIQYLYIYIYNSNSGTDLLLKIAAS